MAEQKEILESIRDVLGGIGGDDILDLTQKVNDDGSITEITPKHKVAASAGQRIEPVLNILKTEAETPPPSETPAPAPSPQKAMPQNVMPEETDDILSEIDSILNSKTPAAKVELEFTPKQEKLPTPAPIEDKKIETKKFEIAEEFEATVPEAIQEPLKQAAPMPDANIMPRSEEEISQIENMKETKETNMDNENITADEAKSSISELMGKLKEHGKDAQMPKTKTPFRSGATMEDLVAEMLKPMMKDWLDNNLPKLVKETVQKEIAKLIPKE